MIKNLAFCFDAFHQAGELMQAEGFQNGFAVQLAFQVEEVFEGAVGEVDPVVAVEQQQPLQHGIEKELLPGQGLVGGFFLPEAGGLPFVKELPLLATELAAPPEVKASAPAQGQKSQQRPHGLEN